MARFSLVSLVALMSLVLISPAQAAELINSRVMPRSANLQLKDEGHMVGDAYSLQWPAVVKSTNGLWLQVEDAGNVSSPAVKGWVRADDVIAVGQALSFYNKELMSQPNRGDLYWLRGICWESSREPELAHGDYAKAVELHGYNPDAALGLARTTAKHEYNEALFMAAKAQLSNSPRFYLEWGQALAAAHQPDRARAAFEQAGQLVPNWKQPPYLLGKLAMAQGDADKAVQLFQEAIRRDNTFVAAHRDIAAALLVDKSNPENVTRGLAAARKACEYSNFRECESLAVLADACASLENWPEAKRYQHLAVEYAGFAQKSKFKERWLDYWVRSQGKKILLASNDTKSGVTAQGMSGGTSNSNAGPSRMETIPKPAAMAGNNSSAEKLSLPSAAEMQFLDRSAGSFDGP